MLGDCSVSCLLIAAFISYPGGCSGDGRPEEQCNRNKMTMVIKAIECLVLNIHSSTAVAR